MKFINKRETFTKNYRENLYCVLIYFILQIGELAVLINDKVVGKPRRNPVTGLLENHHLGNSDVSLQVI